MKRHIAIIAIVALFLLQLGTSVKAQSPEPTLNSSELSLKGKDVTLLFGFSAGGPMHIYLQQLAPYLKKHLPGNPNVIVKSMPGAGGMRAANFFYKKARPNGQIVMMYYSGLILKHSLRVPSVRFNLDKMSLLGAVSTNNVLIFHESTGIKKAKDLMNVSKTILAGINMQNSVLHLTMKTFLSIFDVPYRSVFGYRGMSKLLHAIRVGEISAIIYGAGLFFVNRKAFKSNGLTAICQRGYLETDGTVTGDDVLDLPTCHGVAKQFKPNSIGSPDHKIMTVMLGASALGRAFFLPPNTKKEWSEIWSKAFSAAHADPVFMTEAKKLIGLDVKFRDSTVANKILERISKIFEDAPTKKAIEQITSDDK